MSTRFPRNFLALCAAALLCLPAAGCQQDDPTGELTEGLSAREFLIRASLDFRAKLPTPEEFDQVAKDPDSVDSIVSGFVEDARFGERVRALFMPIYRTRIDHYPIFSEDYGLDPDLDAPLQAAIGEEPLRIIERIAVEDLSYTELVTGDWTMADDVLGAVWPLDYPDGESGWQVARYTDDRPPAGVLSTNSMWWRYQSNGINNNRGRANALSRILLCDDYLSRPVEFPRDIDLTDNAAVENALRTNAGCVNCHISLDPLASFLYGFTYQMENVVAEVTPYHPERELLWQTRTGVSPGYFGTPGWTLSDMGQLIAADHRFVSCAAEQVYGGLLQRDLTPADQDALIPHRNTFVESGLRLKALFSSVLTDPAYRGIVPLEDGEPKPKLMKPDLYMNVVEDLTGYYWTAFGFDLVNIDRFGFRTLGGGEDGYTGARGASGPIPTMLLVHQRISETAAVWRALQDRDDPGSATLFTEVDFTETVQSDRAAIEGQIDRLYLRIFGTDIDPDMREDLVQVFDDSLPLVGNDNALAWAVVLSVMLRDPELVTY